MKATLVLALFALILVGCSSNADNSASNAPTAPNVESTAQSPSPASGGVAPMASGAAGGMTPMSGTDSVQGSGGGGVGAAAKGMAKEKAGLAGGSSLDQMPTGE